MKKIIFLVIIILIFGYLTGYNNLTLGLKNEKKDSSWEYLKDRVFDNNIKDIRTVKSLDKLILLDLFNATKEDSLAINEIISEFKNIVEPYPASIYYTGDFIKGYKSFFENKEDINDSQKRFLKSTIEISFQEQEESKQVSNNQFENVYFNKDVSVIRFKNKKLKGYPFGYISFSFNPEITSEKRKHHIKYGVFREFFVMKVKPMTNNFANSKVKESSFFEGVKYEPEKAVMNSKDKFLLKELYGFQFEEKFKKYLFDHYTWQYAANFINKENLKAIASISVFCISVLIFILFFMALKRINYKYSFFSYFVPIVIAYYCIYHLYFFYNFLTIGKIEFSSKSFISILIPIILITVPISFLLWYSEKLLIKKNITLVKELTLKMGTTLFSILFPITLFSILGQFKTTPSTWSFPFPIFLSFLKRKLLYVFSWENTTLVFLLILIFARAFLILINYFSTSLVREKDVELSRLKEANAQSELKLLQSHINPHFLYNALNSIAGLAHTNANKTEKMALSLSDLFRYSINKKGQKMSTVNEEVTMVQNYLDIEKIRFGERLTFSLFIDESLNDEKIPMYILQPLVENAIKHGISKIRGEAKIGLEIIKNEEESLLISVSDNGHDFPKGLVSGHGLQTVNDLLRLSYGEKASLKWQNTPEKKITISISQTA